MFIFTATFILGSIVSSFLNVVAKSLPVKQNWWSRRSACPYCQKKLTARQLIPIVSFLIQKGRCHHCNAKLSRLYLLSEITGGLLFAVPTVFFSTSFFEILNAWLFFSLLLTLTLTDLYYQLIPNKILIAFGVPILFMNPNIVTGVVGFLFFYGTSLLGKFLFKKETIGGGDIKLYFIIGLILPFQPLFLAIVISALTALIYVVFFAKFTRNKPIPFAPFIALGSIISYLLTFN